MSKNSCLALLSCSDKVPCPELFQSLSMRENYTTHLEHAHHFSLQTSAGSAGNGVMGWRDWMARLRINAALNTCNCVSSNTPLRLSSSGTPFHRQLFLFFSFLCLVQSQTSLNNWPWQYFTAEQILRFCTLVRSVKDQSYVKVPFDHVTRALQTVPSDRFFLYFISQYLAIHMAQCGLIDS